MIGRLRGIVKDYGEEETLLDFIKINVIGRR
jgi:hypothetical protein